MPKKNEPKPKKPKKKAQAEASDIQYKMQAAWLFYEGAGTVVHDIYGDLDLTLVLGSGVWTAGVAGRAFDPNLSGYGYHADDSRLDVGANVDCTIIIGLEMPDSAPAARRAMFSKRSVSVGSFLREGYSAYVETDGTVQYDMEPPAGGGSAGSVTATGNHCDGAFHTWAFGRSGSTYFAIKDGTTTWTQVGSGTASVANSEPFRVGLIESPLGYVYPAPIFYVYFYQGRAMSAQTVRDIRVSPFASLVAFNTNPGQNVVGPDLPPPPTPEPADSSSAGSYIVGGRAFIS